MRVSSAIKQISSNAHTEKTLTKMCGDELAYKEIGQIHRIGKHTDIRNDIPKCGFAGSDFGEERHPKGNGDGRNGQGDNVAEGQTVARIHHLHDLTQSALALVAPCAGKVYALGRNHMVKTGHVVVQIASHHYQGTGKLTF